MSTIFDINIRWGGKVYPVTLDTAESPATFMTQVFSITGVPPERQKIMVKGGLLKDGTSWEKLSLRNGTTWIMMGSAQGDGLQKPKERTVFVEDMPEPELAKIAATPSGFENYGNTCYLNATLQCLRVIPEVQEALSQAFSRPRPNLSPRENLALSVQQFMKQAQETTQAVGPFALLQTLRMAYPQFGQQDQGTGLFMQQDAEEAWAQIVSSVNEATKESGAVSKLMSVEMRHTMKSDAAPSEEPTVQTEKLFELPCHISKEVNFLSQGIQEALEQKVEKMSESLQKQVVYTRKSEVSRLPQYLTVHFIRFFWKVSDGVRAKILRKVKFPVEHLDLAEICTPELREKMKDTREWVLEREEDISRRVKQKKAKDVKYGDDAEQSKAMDIEEGQETEPVPDPPIHPDLQADEGCNPSGLYELIGVVTHLGRSSDSGHYVGWARGDPHSERWFKFDDDKVSPVTTESIKKLDGGGDWHMAYLLLYKMKDLDYLQRNAR